MVERGRVLDGGSVAGVRMLYRRLVENCAWVPYLRRAVDVAVSVQPIDYSVDGVNVLLHVYDYSYDSNAEVIGVEYAVELIREGRRLDELARCLELFDWRVRLVLVYVENVKMDDGDVYYVVSHRHPEETIVVYYVANQALLPSEIAVAHMRALEVAREVAARYSVGLGVRVVVFYPLQTGVPSSERRYDVEIANSVRPVELRPPVTLEAYPEGFRRELLEALSATGARNIVMVGPTGTGKSTLARALLRALGYERYIPLTPDRYLYWWLGSTERALRMILEKAKAERIPIVIDDAEHLGSRNINYMSSTDYTKAGLVTLLLHYLEEVEHHNVIIINHIHALDDALLRYGRGDVLLVVLYPDQRTREVYLRNIARMEGVSIPDGDLKAMAGMLDYASVAELKAAVKLYKMGGLELVRRRIRINTGKRRRVELAYVSMVENISTVKLYFPPEKEQLVDEVQLDDSLAGDEEEDTVGPCAARCTCKHSRGTQANYIV